MEKAKRWKYMSLHDFKKFNQDEWLIIQLCLKTNLLTEEQIKQVIIEHPEKQLIFALTDSGLLETSDISKLMEQKKNACLCTKCKSVNLLTGDEAIEFCSSCKTVLEQPLEKATASVRKTSLGYFGKYKVLNKIGAGTFATVYKAEHQELGRFAAIKVLHPRLDSIARQRFYREAKAIAVMNHPNIVTIYDVGEEFSNPYIAMEYVEGQTLADRFPSITSIRQKVQIAIQIADGLQHAHDQGIIHRDIKPDNILLTRNDHVKLADFGLARSVLETVALTQPSTVMGTPMYMSPEQIQSLPLTPSTDIYSLGVVLYEMLVGTPPFNHDDQQMLLHRILYSPVPPLSRFSINVPAYLENICMTALQKEPKKRFDSAKTMSQALSHYFDKTKTDSLLQDNISTIERQHLERQNSIQVIEQIHEYPPIQLRHTTTNTDISRTPARIQMATPKATILRSNLRPTTDTLHQNVNAALKVRPSYENMAKPAKVAPAPVPSRRDNVKNNMEVETTKLQHKIKSSYSPTARPFNTALSSQTMNPPIETTKVCTSPHHEEVPQENVETSNTITPQNVPTSNLETLRKFYNIEKPSQKSTLGVLFSDTEKSSETWNPFDLLLWGGIGLATLYLLYRLF